MNFETIAQCLVDGQTKKVRDLVQQSIDQGCTAKQILNEGLLVGMNEVGNLFQDEKLFVPEVLMASKAMQMGMDVIAPLLKEGDKQSKAKIVLASVKGDLHDIGIRSVGMMFESAGYEIIYLGTDVPASKIVEAVKTNQANLVGLAALLTRSMMNMKSTIKALKDAELYDKVKVLVGGAPVTDRFADQIGGHYAADAVIAVELANKFC